MINPAALETERETKVALLDTLEAEFEGGVEDYNRAKDRMAVAVHEIQQSGLWMYRLDDNGRHYHSWETYLTNLVDRKGLSRTSLYKYKGSVKFAIANGFVESSEDFVNGGGVDLYNSIRAETTYNYVTGEITGLKADPDNPDPIGTIKRGLEKVDPSMPPRDKVALILDEINPNRVEVFFKLNRLPEGGWELRHTISGPKGREEDVKGYLMADMPTVVIDEIRARLRIGGR